jgi:putative phosphoribosyl transferase
MSTMLQSSPARAVTIIVRSVDIHAELTVPPDATGLVILAYPTGRSRANSKHQHLIDVLDEAGLATLFCDLLTDEEEMLSDITGEFRHDVALLSRRLTAITDWCHVQPELRSMSVGYLGTGAGAAAAFISAAQRPTIVGAIVARGGRLDLAWTSLSQVRVPVLLVAGQNDDSMRESYGVCLPHIGSSCKEIAIIPHAGALFCEPTMLDKFTERAANWLAEHLGEAGGAALRWGPTGGR